LSVTYYLAIDAGTTGVRAIVFAHDGTARGASYRELRMSYPRPGWVEQDPEELWASTLAVVGEALKAARCDVAEVAAVGVANQRASAVAWDAKTLRALGPMIVWQDVRTAERCIDLGNRGFFVTPNTSATKFEWLVRNVPAAAEAAASDRLRLGTPDSFLCAKLTGGRHASDHSNASTTGIYAHMEHAWDGALLEALELQPSWMPELVDSSGVIGAAHGAIVGSNAPLASMAGDQQASLYGLGCRAAGQTKCSYGTAAMVDANTGAAIMMGGPGSYPLVAWSVGGEISYCVEGTVITAGAAIQWLRDGLGVIASAAEVSALAETVGDAGGVWVVPAFQGLGTPHSVSGARALVGGLSRGSTRAHVARAFLEGIAHRVTDAAECVWEACERPSALRVDGGASESDTLLQMQADLLGMPVERSSVREGAALGAAALAANAVRPGEAEALASWRPRRVFEPRASAAEREERRATWKRRLALAAQETA
jgi:glycerol kinase